MSSITSKKNLVTLALLGVAVAITGFATVGTHAAFAGSDYSGHDDNGDCGDSYHGHHDWYDSCDDSSDDSCDCSCDYSD